jgi:hypothetical protein
VDGYNIAGEESFEGGQASPLTIDLLAALASANNDESERDYRKIAEIHSSLPRYRR